MTDVELVKRLHAAFPEFLAPGLVPDDFVIAGTYEVFNLHDLDHAFMVVERLSERYDITLTWSIWKGKLERDVEICMREDDPNYPNGGCRESGDDRLAYVAHDSINYAICLAALEAVEER